MGGDEDNDPEESEPADQWELKASGLHSPWGIVYMLIEKTGWTWHYVFWKVSWINIQMMLADQPRYKYEKPGKQVAEDDDEIATFLGF